MQMKQSSEKYFSFSIFMRKLSQLGRTFDCIMAVQQEAIGRADPKHILNTENILNHSLLTEKETNL